MPTKMKLCTRHGTEHLVTDFPKDKKQHDRLSNWCKLAWREYRAGKPAAAKPAAKVAGAKKPAAKKPAAKKAAAKKPAAKEVN